MMQDVLEQYFWLLVLVAVVPTLGYLGQRWYARYQRGSIFPDLAPERIKYQELTASGRSHKTWWTKLGGANNCLKLVVTDEELWVTSWFPFVLLVQELDLEHRILRSRIVNVSERNGFLISSIIIHFIDALGKGHKIELMPKNYQGFLDAIDPDKRLRIVKA